MVNIVPHMGENDIVQEQINFLPARLVARVTMLIVFVCVVTYDVVV